MTSKQEQSNRKHNEPSNKQLRVFLQRHKQHQRRGGASTATTSGNIEATDPPPVNPPGIVAAVASMKQPARQEKDDSLVLRSDHRGEVGVVVDEFTWTDEMSPVGAKKPSTTAITHTNQLQSPYPHQDEDTAISNPLNDEEYNRANSESRPHSTNSNIKILDDCRPVENAMNRKLIGSTKSGKTKQPNAVKVTTEKSMRTQTAAASSSSFTEWTCPKCTLCNPMPKRRCQVCQERRPTDVSFGGLQLLSSPESISTAGDAVESPVGDLQPKGDQQTVQVPTANQSCGGSSRKVRSAKPKSKVDGVTNNQKSGGSTLPLVVTMNQTQNRSATKRTVPENATMLLSSTVQVSGASTKSHNRDRDNQLHSDNSHSQHQPSGVNFYSSTLLQEQQQQQQQHFIFLQLQREQNELLEQQKLLFSSKVRLGQEHERLLQEQHRVRQEQQDNQRSIEINRNQVRRNKEFLSFFQMTGQPLGPRPETLQASTCQAVSTKDPPLQQTPTSHCTATTAASTPMTSESRSTGKTFRSDKSPASCVNENGIELDEEAPKDDAAPYSSTTKTDMSVTEEGREINFAEPSLALSPLTAPRPQSTTDVPSPANSTQTMDYGGGDRSSRPNSKDPESVVGFDAMEAEEVGDDLEASQNSTQTMDFPLSLPRPTKKSNERGTASSVSVKSRSHAIQSDENYSHPQPSAKATLSIAPFQRCVTTPRAENSASSPAQNDDLPMESHRLHGASPTNLTATRNFFELDKPEENILSKDSRNTIDQTDSRPSSKHASSARATPKLLSAPKSPIPPESANGRSTKPNSCIAGAWQSNKPSRDFYNELERRAEHPLTAAPSSSPAAASSAWKTVSATMPTKSSIPSRYFPIRDNLWDESQEASQPGYAYKETVRCKAVRQGLQCYECPECRRFYEVLRKTGHDIPGDFAKPSEIFGRHRARHVPNETPEDFWELDFIDEMGTPKEKKRKAESKDGNDGSTYEKRPKP